MKQETPRARSIKGAKDLIKGLNPDHDLFNHLHDEMPQWWLNLLDDPEIYIEVRKENYINAYYYGGNIAKITWNNGYVAKTHPAFKDKANDWKRISSLREEQISKKRILKKEGKSKEADAIKLEPYPSSDLVDCLGLLSSKEGIDLLKRNILDIYLQDDGNAKGLATTSEKKIQGKLITETGSPYIDSEFALNYVDTEAGNTENALQRVRIDLIELVDGNIRFVEL